MTAVDIFKASRMKQIEDTTIVSGLVGPDGHLLLNTRAGEEIDAGYVKGDPGDPGDPGPPGEDGIPGSAATPAGTITLWAADTAPANWLICDGSAVSRTQYPSLFDAIGIKYGAGDGVNTFNLPNLKGQTPIGKDASQTEFATLNQKGGEKKHLLTAAESGTPAHNHTQNPHSHPTRIKTSITWAASAGSNIYGLDSSGTTPTDNATATNNSNTAADAAQAHNILQPYTVVNFIIKATAGETPGDSELATRLAALESNFSGTPAGTITGWAGATAPTNWLICDGAAVSRTIYASLFAAIGTSYGVGNNSTTFNLPDLRGRVAVGKSSSDTEFDVLGESGGEKAHTLTIAEMPSHRHDINTKNPGTATRQEVGMGDTSAGTGGLGTTAIQPTGGGAAHNNIQPYQVLNYIIKITNGDTKADSQLTQRVSDIESGSAYSVRVRERARMAQRVLSGGGIRTVSNQGVTWSERFIVIGAGRDTLTQSGYWDIACPPVGTVIPVYNSPSATSVTVLAGSIIPLTGWGALYYELPMESTFTSDPARFRIVDYRAGLASLDKLPSNWVMIAACNIDSYSAQFTWGDGRSSDPWKALTMQNAWVQFDTLDWGQPAWRFTDDGQVELKGMMKAGTAVAVCALLDVKLCPVDTTLWHQPASGGFWRLDVLRGGNIQSQGAIAGGNNGWVKLQGMSWRPGNS